MLVTKTPVHIFLVILFLKYGVCVNLTLCYPAEEGRQHTLIFSLDINNLRLKFTIDNEKSFVTECLLETLYCSNEQSKKAFSVLEKKDLNDYTLNITIWNATRESDFGFEGLWTLTNDEDSNVFMSCSLKIFAKASNVTCESKLVNTFLHLNCWTERIYPEGKCIFFSKDIEMIRTLVVNYQHTNVTEKPVYYRSSCSIALSISNIRNGTHDVTVTMYPNITGNDTDIFFGTNKTYKIDLEQQGLTLRECPQVIEVGAIISCRCEKSHFILKDISIDWYDENQHKILNTSNILRFKVSRNSIKYTCVGQTVTGNSNVTALYRPLVYIRPYNFTCRKQLADQMFISCNAIGVYPEPRCVFVVYDNIGKVKLQNEAMTRQNKVHSGNITQYKAACDFNISDSLRNHELRVDVIMYPHITGQFTDLTFGTNATVTLDITNKAENYIEKLTIDILCTFAITAVCIVVVAAIAFYCYKKGVINFLRQRIQGTLPHQVEQEPNQLGNNDGRNDRVVRENVNEDTTLGDSSEATRDDDAPNISEENSNRNDEELDDEHGDVERRVNLSEDGTQPKFIGGACGGVDNCEKEPCIVKSVLYTKYNDSGDPEEGVSLLYPR